MRPDIILLTIDTLRYDAFMPNHMPNLYKFAEDNAVIYENCYAHSSWTRASFGSLLSGKLPGEHRAIRNVLTFSALKEGNINFDEGITVETLPEKLARIGYQTIEIQGNPLIFSPMKHTFNSRFKSSVSCKPIRLFYPEANLISRLFQYLRSQFCSPFFIWLNFMDPHCPYHPPEEYHPVIKNNAYLYPKQEINIHLSAEDKQNIARNYYLEAKFVDDEIAKILHLFEDCVVIFTSDHGEELWEHGCNRADEEFYNRGIDHGHTLYDELIHVPLFIKNNSDVGRSKELISHIALHDWLAGNVIGLPNSVDAVYSENLLYGEECQSIVKFNGESLVKFIKRNGNIEMFHLPDEHTSFSIQDEISFPPKMSSSSSILNDTEIAIQQLKGLGYL